MAHLKSLGNFADPNVSLSTEDEMEFQCTHDEDAATTAGAEASFFEMEYQKDEQRWSRE